MAQVPHASRHSQLGHAAPFSCDLPEVSRIKDVFIAKYHFVIMSFVV
jgi:hypothetical protein